MIIKNTTQVGNPIIRRKSRPVPRANSPATKRIVRNLIDSMRYHGLVGMAAPQIGIDLKIFVSEIRRTKTRKPKESDPVRIFINPEIISRSRRQISGYEGCGSVASSGLFGKVRRPNEVVVAAFDEKGKKFKLRARGLLARIIQHENDHLNGMVFLDRMSSMKDLISREEYLKTK